MWVLSPDVWVERSCLLTMGSQSFSIYSHVYSLTLQNMYYNEIGLCAQDLLNISSSTVNTPRKELYDQLYLFFE